MTHAHIIWSHITSRVHSRVLVFIFRAAYGCAAQAAVAVYVNVGCVVALMLHLLSLRKQLQVLRLDGGQHGNTLRQAMVRQHLAVRRHGHREHRLLWKALDGQRHLDILIFGRRCGRLYLIRVQHLDLHRLLGVAGLLAGHRDGQNEGLRMLQIGRRALLDLRLEVLRLAAVEGAKELHVAIGAGDQAHHLLQSHTTNSFFLSIPYYLRIAQLEQAKIAFYTF